MSIGFPISRREALRSIGLGPAMPLIPRSLWVGDDKGFAIRTTTAGINLSAPDNCGTGLDVVPLPGDASAEQLAGLVLDVAALSEKYRKPLSARRFPIPGQGPGDAISFENPFLTDCVVMPLA